jgi:flagellar motor switch/type III secretory pathway protein FliN
MENTIHAPEDTAESAPDIKNQPATHPSMPPSAEKQAEASEGPECTEIVPSYQMQLVSDEDATDLPTLPEHLRQIPFRLELRVPLSRFTLRDLQQLKPGALLVTEHLSVRDLVLTADGERLLLVELEAIEQQLAARVKRLAWRHKWRRKA